ncbi:MAG: hypothetical protein ACPGU7_13310, partial [Gammaproteobacteria bacterium]
RIRSADVVADNEVTLLQFQPARLEESDDPLAMQVRLKMFRNLSEINMERLKQSNGEIRMLTR